MPDLQTQPEIAMVVAAARNNVIGHQGELPWILKDDMALFKKLTISHPIIMGRKTAESLSKPLPKRRNLVVTRSGQIPEGFEKWASLDEAMAVARASEGADRICIIGGGEMYRLALPQATAVYLSRVDAEPDGDATFPELNPVEWGLVEEQFYPASERNQYGFTFQQWVRRK